MHKMLKAAAATASGMALTFSVALATELPASAASSCTTAFSQYHSITSGTSGSQARAAQCLLRSAGYGVRVDGSFSSADSAQLKKFQRSHHVNVTGSVNASSWTALLARGSQPALQRESRGDAVRRLQRALTASGRPVPVTGYYGSITTNAVRSLQRAKHLSTTGAVTPSVWRALQAGNLTVKRAAVTKPAKAKVRAASTKMSASSRGSRAVAFAKRQRGDRYVWGAAGPNSWDCSGLTRGAWRSAGVGLPHSQGP